MNNIKNIILLFCMYYIATVHLTDNLAVNTREVDELEIDKPVIAETVNLTNDVAIEMETDTPRVAELDKLKRDTSEIDEIEIWANYLKPAKVVEWRLLYSTFSDSYYKNYLKKVLAMTRCPTHILNNLAEKYFESNWPPGISNKVNRALIMLSNMSLMDSYNCRRLPSTTISIEVVVVLASDNKTMPQEMIDEQGFVMFFGKGGTADKEDIAGKIATDTPDVDTLEIAKPVLAETVNLTNDVIIDINQRIIDEIEKWANSLKPAEVVEWGHLYPNISGSYYRDYLKKVLANTRCPTRIMNNLTENYIERNWPPGISTVTKRTWIKVYNRSLMNSYKCRRLPTTTISKEIVVVLASDNKTMPQEMIDEFGFVMFFGRGGIADKEEIATEMGTDIPEVDDSEINKLNIDQPEKDEELHLINDVIIETAKLNINASELSEIEKWSNSLKPAKVVYWRRLYSNLSSYYKDYLKRVLDITGCQTQIVNDLGEKYIESKWPPGILTPLERAFSRELMNSYNYRRLPGTTISKEVVVVLASDNKHMLEDMIDGLGFVMFFNKGGTIDREDNAVEMATNTTELKQTVNLMNDVVIEIDTSDLWEIEKWSNSLKPAKVVQWDRLLTTHMCFEDNLAKLLVVNGCPTHIANDLAEKYNENHWPLGISNATAQDDNINLMNNYNCRRLPGIKIVKEAVIVFASDNKTMPKEMNDEIGFIMFFDKGGTVDLQTQRQRSFPKRARKKKRNNYLSIIKKQFK